VQERLTLLPRERGVGIREDEADGTEEVGFARPVAAYEEVETGTGEEESRVEVEGAGACQCDPWGARSGETHLKGSTRVSSR
jgi:hypothetical protein